jgi:hypothetical protein
LFKKYNDKTKNDDPTVMVGGLWFSDGIKESNDYKNCMICGEDGLMPFSKYSGLKYLLHVEKMMLPPFYFYYNKNIQDIKELKDFLAKTIFEILKDDITLYAKELLEEIKKLG